MYMLSWFVICSMHFLGHLDVAALRIKPKGLDVPEKSSVIPLWRYKHKSYYFGTYKATFLEAGQICKIINMELVRIESAEENSILSTIYQTTDFLQCSNFWTSGSKMFDGKTWIWTTTIEPVKYFNWNVVQIHDSHSEPCLELMATIDGLNFNDRYCNDKLGFICEKRASTKLEVANSQVVVNVYINDTSVKNTNGVLAAEEDYQTERFPIP